LAEKQVRRMGCPNALGAVANALGAFGMLEIARFQSHVFAHACAREQTQLRNCACVRESRRKRTAAALMASSEE
jgi:hypothetical protein